VGAAARAVVVRDIARMCMFIVVCLFVLMFFSSFLYYDLLVFVLFFMLFVCLIAFFLFGFVLFCKFCCFCCFVAIFVFVMLFC